MLSDTNRVNMSDDKAAEPSTKTTIEQVYVKAANTTGALTSDSAQTQSEDASVQPTDAATETHKPAKLHFQQDGVSL